MEAFKDTFPIVCNGFKEVSSPARLYLLITIRITISAIDINHATAILNFLLTCLRESRYLGFGYRWSSLFNAT